MDIDKIYVYENRPNPHIRVHRGNCSHCNYGEGKHHRLRETGVNDEWYGPFFDIEEAWHFALSLNYVDTEFCYFCLRKWREIYH